MAKIDKAFGKLVLADLPSDVCWTTPEKFIEQLTHYLSVELDPTSLADFVLIGPQTPSEDDKNRLWIRLYSNGTFAGFYHFEGGKWTRISNHRPDEIVWFHGDSRSIPEGYRLIDGSLGTMTSSVREHIMSFYHQDLSVENSTVYDYFACIYVGTTIA